MAIAASSEDVAIEAEALTAACDAALLERRRPDDVYTACTHALRRLTRDGRPDAASSLLERVCDLATINAACTDVVFDATLPHFDRARALRTAERLVTLPAGNSADRSQLLDPKGVVYDVERARRVLPWAERNADGRSPRSEWLLPHLVDSQLPHYDRAVAERVIRNYEEACFEAHLQPSCETLSALTRDGGLFVKPATAFRAAQTSCSLHTQNCQRLVECYKNGGCGVSTDPVMAEQVGRRILDPPIGTQWVRER
jgi:hypothetical protein